LLFKSVFSWLCSVASSTTHIPPFSLGTNSYTSSCLAGPVKWKDLTEPQLTHVRPLVPNGLGVCYILFMGWGKGGGCSCRGCKLTPLSHRSCLTVFLGTRFRLSGPRIFTLRTKGLSASSGNHSRGPSTPSLSTAQAAAARHASPWSSIARCRRT
jgi:hypothetical protein